MTEEQLEKANKIAWGISSLESQLKYYDQVGPDKFEETLCRGDWEIYQEARRNAITKRIEDYKRELAAL